MPGRMIIASADELPQLRENIGRLTGVWLDDEGLAALVAFVHVVCALRPGQSPAAQPDPDGWIPWTGGKNPAPGKTVDVRFRGSEGTDRQISECWDWVHCDSGGDIVAYRVLG